MLHECGSINKKKKKKKRIGDLHMTFIRPLLLTRSPYIKVTFFSWKGLVKFTFDSYSLNLKSPIANTYKL